MQMVDPPISKRLDCTITQSLYMLQHFCIGRNSGLGDEANIDKQAQGAGLKAEGRIGLLLKDIPSFLYSITQQPTMI